MYSAHWVGVVYCVYYRVLEKLSKTSDYLRSLRQVPTFQCLEKLTLLGVKENDDPNGVLLSVSTLDLYRKLPGKHKSLSRGRPVGGVHPL